MGKLVVLFWVFVSGMVESLVSGVWMSIWVAGLVGFSSVFLLGGFSVYWIILSLVYLGGIFILLVYVSGSGSAVSSGGGGFVVCIGLAFVGLLGLVGRVYSDPSAISVFVLSSGGYMVALITAPALLWVMVNVNWVLYGHSGTMRSS
uniref:NADH dehydrogenase subunit 6 n=1 Tax=Bolbosoma nipponicum TaxID=1167864 RepID=UPI002E7A95DD|nr:NADH dehydrogenase subunit 6 [Bolbosoma nipponicum]WPN89830.1 NADH dehydrogenase subunit 6 [Bolbosoma nipponicum]